MNRMCSEQGAAIPMALLVMIVLTLLVAVGFAATSSEARMNANQDAVTDVFTLAETGLELFLAKRDSFGFTASPPAVSESTRVILTGGYADVVLTRVRNNVAASRYGYIIRSHGVSTVATLSGTARAERTVAEYASWQVGTMKVLAGWNSLTGLNKNGAAGTLSGDDGCVASPQPSVAGVSVPTNPGYTGSQAPLSGSPPLQLLGTQAQAIAATKIDWDGIINHGAITPDITIPPGSWPASFPATYWPVIKLVGDWNLPGPGHGTLIVTGNMTISGSNMWDGVILAGGNLTSNGNNTVEGAVVSGLNVILGASLPQGAVGNGTKTYQYNSCNVASAMAKMAQLVAYTNAWVDNWPTY